MQLQFQKAMEALSCGTPMLAANAQGYAMYLSHGVNASLQAKQLFTKSLSLRYLAITQCSASLQARLFTPGSSSSFDEELAKIMETKREGDWSPESIRATMAARMH